jgi:hypothetical protein
VNGAVKAKVSFMSISFDVLFAYILFDNVLLLHIRRLLRRWNWSGDCESRR